jgi:hypothetical protein
MPKRAPNGVATIPPECLSLTRMDRETLRALHIPGLPLCVPGLALQLQVSFALRHPDAHDNLWRLWALHMEHCNVCGVTKRLLVA